MIGNVLITQKFGKLIWSAILQNQYHYLNNQILIESLYYLYIYIYIKID